MTPRDQFGLDALLGRWPAQDPQENGGISWDERADAIVKSAVALKDQASTEVLAALLEAPPLEAEPGEEKAGDFQFQEATPARAAAGSLAGAETGEKRTMSTSDSPKRPSLKELAARASVAGAGRASVTPLPPSIRPSVPPMPPSVPASVTPISKAAKAARASDPGREDSGVLRLADIQASEASKAEAAAAAAEASLAAANAKRAEGKQAAVAASVASPAAAEGKRSSTGMVAGVAIAVLGIAAAFAVYQSRTPAPSQTPTAASSPEMKPMPAPVASEAPKPATEPTAVAAADPTSAATAAPAADDAKGGAAGGAPTSTAVVVASNDVRPSAQASAKPGSKVGTLDEEMKKAVGANELPSAPQDDGSKPAAGGGGNVPEQPSQGNAQAAVRAVLPGAKACVAGAPEPTTASITFSSSGSASSVSVGGWAAANGKAGCVKSALMGARVSPFAKPSYTVPVTVRP